MSTGAGNERSPLFFADTTLARGSAREWIIGEGHVSLPEARQRAIADLTEAEADLEARDAELAAAQADFVRARRNRDKAYEARQRARGDVKRKQGHVAYVCSTPAPEGAEEVLRRD